MYSILIVDDEPASCRYLKTIVETKCPAFRVADTAADGAEGLEKATSIRPDLVITDIRMPGMDGLDFASALKKAFPSLPAIIVSGFQEFDYARRALGTGVSEYLLKPVNPLKLAETLASLVSVIEDNRNRSKLSAAKELLRGNDATKIDNGTMGRERFWLAVLREGGPLSRLRGPGESMENESIEEEVRILRGRDDRESVFLADCASLAYDDFVRKVSRFAQARPRYRTLVFADHDIPPDELAETAKDLYRTTDRSIVLGKEMTIFTAPKEEGRPDLEPTDIDRIDYCVTNTRPAEFRKIIASVVARWEREDTPLAGVKSASRKLLLFIRRKNGSALKAKDEDDELEELADGAPDWKTFSDGLESIAARAAGLTEGEASSVDVPGFFASIRARIDASYAEPLTLGTMSETFRISQVYLSRLFREYEGMSFNEYLTKRRIEAAKKLIRESPSMPLKDVALFVGISDPFYFSRIFKNAVGTPPSEFRSAMTNNP